MQFISSENRGQGGFNRKRVVKGRVLQPTGLANTSIDASSKKDIFTSRWADSGLSTGREHNKPDLQTQQRRNMETNPNFTSVSLSLLDKMCESPIKEGGACIRPSEIAGPPARGIAYYSQVVSWVSELVHLNRV